MLHYSFSEVFSPSCNSAPKKLSHVQLHNGKYVTEGGGGLLKNAHCCFQNFKERLLKNYNAVMCDNVMQTTITVLYEQERFFHISKFTINF